VPAGWSLLVDAARTVAGEVVDASGTMGVAGRAAEAATRVRIVEPSAIALDVIRYDLGGYGPEVTPGLPWDLEPKSADSVLLAPAAERGSARVRAELAAAARALRPDGTAYLLLERDRGAKRYEREARTLFGDVEVVARQRGARLSRLRNPGLHQLRSAAESTPWTEFEVDGQRFHSLAGCFASGKLDPGSALLLRELDRAGAVSPHSSVWDLGCGWGPLAHAAQQLGALVSASDDDLAAVRSCRANVPGAKVEHADLDGALAPGVRFDRVLVNPPFHVGAGLRLALGREFIEVALRRVTPEGEAWFVANAELGYEREASLPRGWRLDQVTRESGFSVLRARPQNAR